MATKEKIGVVVSNKMNNTRIVQVTERVAHKKYKKVVSRTKRFAVHDSEINSGLGDKVQIQETKPISKTKNWYIVRILEKSKT
jgi:small subunit ribosomal protein S17